MWSRIKQIFSGTPGTREDCPSAETGGDTAGKDSPADTPVPDLTWCYKELGVVEGTDLNAIRRVWKAKLKEVHNDHYAEDPETKRRAQEKAHRINEAYHTLSERLF